MHFKRAISILRVNVNKDKPVVKTVKWESSISFSKTVIFEPRKRQLFAKFWPSAVIDRKSVRQFVQSNTACAINENVKSGQNINDAADNETQDENIDTCAPPIDFDTVSTSLQSCSSVQKQLEALYSILKLEPQDIKMRKNICQSVKNVLSPFFKNCYVQMYGSCVNGFGFKGCDIDMSFGIVGAKKVEPPPPYEEIDIPFVNEVLSGQFALEKLVELPPKEQLIFIHSVLVDYYKESSESILFINAYVPIIRFHHGREKIQCDFSYANRVAYSNTKLLKLYANFDKRITILTVAIRYWAKRAGLVGKGLMFNSYTITLLIVYFLQTRNPPVLPTVEYILSLSDALSNGNMADESYLDIIKELAPSENKQTPEELLKEFFWFYTYFDYTRVICPLTGTSIPRNDFFPFNPKFRLNTICIQDPLKLVHNVATLVDFKHCKLFFTEVLKALKLCNNDALWYPNSNSSKWGLLAILDIPAHYSTSLSAGDSQLCFEISKSLKTCKNVKEENNTGSLSVTDEDQLWLQQASQAVLDVLEYALLFKCTIVDSINLWPYKSSHTTVELENEVKELNQTLMKTRDDASSLNKSEGILLTADCIAFNNTWLGREDIKVNNSSVNPLEIEHEISSKLSCQEIDEKKKALIRFVCECHSSRKKESASLLVKFKPYQRADFNPILGLFLTKYVPEFVNRVLQAHNTDFSRHQGVSGSF